MRRLVIVMALLTGLAVAPASAAAATLFSDDFDAENSGVGIFNYFGFANFAVTNGTVDLIGNGFYDFLPGNGLYVDLDGSTADAGFMSAHPLSLGPGQYQLTFDLAGSQRGTGESVDVVVFGSALTYASYSYFVESSEPFINRSVGFTLASSDLIQFSFLNLGGDNFGALLDDVAVTGTPVPEPGTLLLLGCGLALGVGGRVRRHRN